MNTSSGSPMSGPSRRSVLTVGLTLSASLVAEVSKAQTREPMTTRSIPHSGEQLPVVGLGTAVSFPSADAGAAAGAQGT